MSKMRKKVDLPIKICKKCERPFTWRKKWEKTWEEVRYCSDGCRKDYKSSQRTSENKKALISVKKLLS